MKEYIRTNEREVRSIHFNSTSLYLTLLLLLTGVGLALSVGGHCIRLFLESGTIFRTLGEKKTSLRTQTNNQTNILPNYPISFII
jgi:hypothetical protein